MVSRYIISSVSLSKRFFISDPFKAPISKSFITSDLEKSLIKNEGSLHSVTKLRYKSEIVLIFLSLSASLYALSPTRFIETAPKEIKATMLPILFHFSTEIR